MAGRLQLLAVALLAASTLAACGGSKPASQSAGKPGVEITLHLASPAGSVATNSDVSQVERVMRARLRALGAKGTVTGGPRPRDIIVRIDGARPGTTETRLMVDQANLEFYDLSPALLPPSRDAAGDPVPSESLCGLLKARTTRQAGNPSASYLVGSRCRRLAGPLPRLHGDKAAGKPGLLDAFAGRIPQGDKVLSVPAQTVVITCSEATTVVCPDGTNATLPPVGKSFYYLFKHGTYPGDQYGPYPSLTGGDVELSGTQQDFDPATGMPIVTIYFTRHGAKAFQQVTRHEAMRGETAGLGANCAAICAFAIVLDDELRSWPAIDPTQNPQGIDPGRRGAQITGIGATSEARSLALVLQTGALPAQLVVVSERAVR